MIIKTQSKRIIVSDIHKHGTSEQITISPDNIKAVILDEYILAYISTNDKSYDFSSITHNGSEYWWNFAWASVGIGFSMVDVEINGIKKQIININKTSIPNPIEINDYDFFQKVKNNQTLQGSSPNHIIGKHDNGFNYITYGNKNGEHMGSRQMPLLGLPSRIAFLNNDKNLPVIV